MSGLSIGLRILTASLLLLSPRLWPWGLDRQSTFFGVRVPPDFADSEAGRNILRIFRRRLWICTFALAVIYAVAAPAGPIVMFLWFNGALMSTVLIYVPLYALAQRQARAYAGPVSESTVRTATLLPDEERQLRGLALAAWMVMIVPTALPLLTGILLVWNRFVDAARLQPVWLPSQVAIAACLGLFGTCTQYALRFRARASDWATTPEASLKYRTYLGLMMGAISLGGVLVLCSQALTPLFPWRGMRIIWSGMVFLVSLALTGLFFWMRSRLAKLFDPQSGDPMADRRVKWNMFYYNPSDLAWVIPARSGIAFSWNLARPMAWAVGGLATAGFVVALLQLARLVPELIRIDSAIGLSRR